MLNQLIEQGFGDTEDFNCAEKILYAANQVYNMNLSADALKLSAGFGGGMGIGETCGALAGGVMVLSHLFVKDHAHESKKIKALSQELFASYRLAMGDINCKQLKLKYRTPETQCTPVIAAAAKALEAVIEKHQAERIN